MKSFNPFSMGSSQSNGNGFNMNNFQKFVDVMNMKNLDPNELLAKMQSSLHTFIVNLIKEKKDKEITDKTTLDVMTNVWKFIHSEILNRIDHIQYKVDKYKAM